ncbi:hypothetical protein ACFY7C_35580 [Streptomyces sp. NPDC012769]|uniref:hypothetical protein n=1 Tax=Streptomyces sp. NPDC012769 TaxID=3364848 RepID=UPI0036BCF03C
MIRNVVGSVLALAGATAAVWSPFRAWYDGRHGRDYRIDELFTGVTDAKAEIIGSILLPFAFAALLTLIGVVLRSRVLVAVAGVVVLGFTVLWMVRVGQVEDGLSVGSDGQGLGDGVANALGGGLLLLIGALVMSGRTRRHATRVDRPRDWGHDDDRGHDEGYDRGHDQGYDRGDDQGYGRGHGGHEGPAGYDGRESGPPRSAPPPSSDVPWDPGRDENPPPPEHRA